MLVAPHYQVRDVRGGCLVGDPRPQWGPDSEISSAKDSGLPLWGVAEVRTSASALGASTWASWLFSVPRLTSLWDSSIHTTSQRTRLEVVPVPARVLEGVDGDDDPVEVSERIAAGRDALAHPGDAVRVETDKRKRAPAPQLVLHLVQDVSRNDSQDSVRSTTSLKLRQQHPDLDRLAEPHSVSNKQTRLELSSGEPEGLALERADHQRASRGRRSGRCWRREPASA